MSVVKARSVESIRADVLEATKAHDKITMEHLCADMGFGNADRERVRAALKFYGFYSPFRDGTWLRRSGQTASAGRRQVERRRESERQTPPRRLPIGATLWRLVEQLGGVAQLLNAIATEFDLSGVYEDRHHNFSATTDTSGAPF